MAEFRQDFGPSEPMEGLRTQPSDSSDPSELARQKGEHKAALGSGRAALVLVEEAADWEDYAFCKSLSPSTFFPAEGNGVEAAKKICKENCPVIRACLEHALTNRIDHGVWGGESERGRRRILKRRRAGA